ncbi:hypothetical protein BH11CYA1_BH11CYA1_17190 [soil metagenome]
MDIIKEGNFKPVGNELGQILLLPVKSVPFLEASIYENPEWLSSVARGIKDIEAGRVVKSDLS